MHVGGGCPSDFVRVASQVGGAVGEGVGDAQVHRLLRERDAVGDPFVTAEPPRPTERSRERAPCVRLFSSLGQFATRATRQCWHAVGVALERRRPTALTGHALP
jgi:hypothetical protein